jgi:serine/threonine protein phosphatase PrpC
MQCRACGVNQEEGVRFCEDCGAPLRAAPAVCPRCGASLDGGGCCARCERQDQPHGRDRLEVVLTARLAGVTDRGRKHARNDDYLALAAEQAGEVLVVCDGVSSSQKPERASEVAASTVCAALRRALQDSRPVGGSTLLRALRSAEEAVRTVPFEPSAPDDPPETTVVAAVRQGRHLTVGWLGDSRAYLVTPGAARQLTEDHSWVNEVVSAGAMTLAAARQSPLAHAITRTLGGRGIGDEPSLRIIDIPDGPALVVLCTDGLWNYTQEVEQLADLVHRQPPGADALRLARALVEHALDRNAHDNVTAAVLILGEPGA